MQTQLRRLVLIPCALMVTGVTGCASWGERERIGAMGAAGGAVIGAAIGTQAGGVARGAIIGAVIGGAAGAIIGHQMDQQAKELEQNIPGAIVERVGEGIAVTFESGLMFDFDSANLRQEARTNLRNLANTLERNPGTNLLIAGHTDSVGRADYNQGLSERRARAASNFLVQEGVSPARIRTLGMGESEPKVSNETEQGRQINRRVEVAIFASEAMQAEARRQAGG